MTLITAKGMFIFSLSHSVRKHFLLFNDRCITHRAPWAVLRGRHNESVGEHAQVENPRERGFIDVQGSMLVVLDFLDSEIESLKSVEKKMFW